MKPTSTSNRATGWKLPCILFAGVTLISLGGVFLPGHTLFSNDGPLGAMMADCHSLPGRFTGCWADVTGIGISAGAAPPNISFVLDWLLGPIWFSRLYAIISLFLLGLSAWWFFRQSRLHPIACVLGGLAAILNSTFFSVACWGMSAHVMAAAMSFVALGLLMDTSARGRWPRVILAGLAVGMGVAEAADVGAILSLYVAAFAAYQAFVAQGPLVRNIGSGLGRLALVTACAVFLASDTISAMVNTAIKGVVQTDETQRTPLQRWNWSTQWSLPKKEALGLIVPGLFGYRLDTPNGAVYWGVIGRDAAWDTYAANGSQGTPPKGFVRYTGGGNYEGVLVSLVAIWGAIQSLRRRDSVFNPEQRKWTWFWLAACIGSLLLAFGKHAPFYRFIYELPYFSDIRNPVKFLYPFSIALIVLFAFGIDGLVRKYMANGPNSAGRWAGLQNWWKKAATFEKYWVYGCGLAAILALVGALVYIQQSRDVEGYMRSTQVTADVNALMQFSIHRVVFFLALFLLSSGLVLLIFSGAFAGKRAKAGGILLGLLIVADLGFANMPWIVYWDYVEKYTSNPVIDVLRETPYEHRVAITPVHLPPEEKVLAQLYQIEWLQQQFPRYNVQSFDMADVPRMPEDIGAFNKMFQQKDTNQPYMRLNRAWQITNTRYLLAPLNFGAYWNEQSYLAGNGLQTVKRFAIVPKPGVFNATKVQELTIAERLDGKFALFELTNALPRAKLFTRWQVSTNNQDALQQIFDPAFDPQSAVVVNANLPSDPAMDATNHPAGVVDFVQYAPKHIVLKAEASAPSVLLLNDHFDPNWKVLVDGQPAQLLRCNLLMRGVHLAPGTHQVDFRFQPTFGLLYVSLAAVALGLLMIGTLVVSANKGSATPDGPVSSPPRAAQPESKPAAAQLASKASNGRKNGRNGKK